MYRYMYLLDLHMTPYGVIFSRQICVDISFQNEECYEFVSV